MGETSVTFGARPFTDACGYGLLRIYVFRSWFSGGGIRVSSREPHPKKKKKKKNVLLDFLRPFVLFC